ncbi:hypothetical protein ACFU8I_02635 [Streptomyces sp. NPDC057540]|uniref:hypothetical protein n=1 Tax=Streptomyces sp. NPDC057540 TaxID=3346160 RepID=UPI0036A08E74
MTSPKTAPPKLEPVYDLKAATIALGLAKSEAPEDKSGQRFLRDGVNRDHNPFPHVRINGQLKFKESQLAEILERHVNAPNPRTGRPRMKRRAAKRVAQPSPAPASQALAA